jgi:hypothetical protein
MGKLLTRNDQYQQCETLQQHKFTSTLFPIVHMDSRSTYVHLCPQSLTKHVNTATMFEISWISGR